MKALLCDLVSEANSFRCYGELSHCRLGLRAVGQDSYSFQPFGHDDGSMMMAVLVGRPSCGSRQTRSRCRGNDWCATALLANERKPSFLECTKNKLQIASSVMEA